MRGIVRACQENRLRAHPEIVISNNSDSQALAFARENGVPALHLNATVCGSPEAFSSRVMYELTSRGVDLIILSGYMKLLGSELVHHYAGRIFNIHPALLPAYGGKGMYGINVHLAVIAAAEKETGITIHAVNERYDDGPIIAQVKLPVHPGDSPDSLAERVKQHEPEFLVETLIEMQS